MMRPKQGMPPPKTRREFEHNVGMVMEDFLKALDSGQQGLIQNKMMFTSKHLQEVRLFPNGRIDLASVNEMLRLQANTLNWMSGFIPPRQITPDENNEEE